MPFHSTDSRRVEGTLAGKIEVRVRSINGKLIRTVVEKDCDTGIRKRRATITDCPIIVGSMSVPILRYSKVYCSGAFSPAITHTTPRVEQTYVLIDSKTIINKLPSLSALAKWR